VTQAEAIEALARLVARGGLIVLSVEPKRRQGEMLVCFGRDA